MVEFDAFAGGIEIGGLRNMLEIKILICYILKSVKTPMKRNQICDTLQRTGLVNYFDANSAIDELLENGTIVEEEYVGETHLKVTLWVPIVPQLLKIHFFPEYETERLRRLLI